MTSIEVQLPDKLVEPLFTPHRYKVLKGGRGSAKSWSVAQALLALGMKSRLRILCAREIQKSIQDSSYKLLVDQIERLGFGGFYKVTKTEIRGSNGTEFLFRGLGNLTAESIKSFEGVDTVWVEEAHTVSKRSWELLIPTIRKNGSEIWVTYNPDEETDPVDVNFVQRTPPGCIVVDINWMDNPWFPEVLKAEKDYLYSVDPDTANHVWGGGYRRVSDAQILRGRWKVKEFTPVEGLWDGPYHGIDFGFSQDAGTMIRMWIWEGDLYIEYEAAGLEVDTDDLPALWDEIPGARNHIARADCSRPETISAVKRAGYNRVVACQKWTGCEEDGIDHLRTYKNIVIHPRCELAIQEAKLWSWKKDRLTGDILRVTTGKFDNTWAAARYGLEPIIRFGLKNKVEEVEDDWEARMMRQRSVASSWAG
jgi:phage terminase large subunit